MNSQVSSLQFSAISIDLNNAATEDKLFADLRLQLRIEEFHVTDETDAKSFESRNLRALFKRSNFNTTNAKTIDVRA